MRRILSTTTLRGYFIFQQCRKLRVPKMLVFGIYSRSGFIKGSDVFPRMRNESLDKSARELD